MEQELASIAKFILSAVGNNVQPYYRNLPESFRCPAVYFPVPEVTTSGDTFNTYSADYIWFVTFIHSSKQDAYELASTALNTIQQNRRLVPLLSELGSQVGKKYIRLHDPSLRVTAENTAVLVVKFTSRRPYTDKKGNMMNSYGLNKYIKK